MAYDCLRPTPDRVRAIAENRLLACQHLSLDRPDNLEETLAVIAQNNSLSDNCYSSPQAVAYFLGHEVACQLWAETNNPVAPFAGLENVVTIHPANEVVRIGCPSRGSFEAGVVFLRKVGLVNVHQTVIDFAPLPLRRLELTNPGDACYLEVDASDYPIGNLEPGIIFTDLLFSCADQNNQRLLANLIHSLPDNSQLLTRVCIVDEVAIHDYFRLMLAAGYLWGDFCRCTYGVDDQGRDCYYGLTEEQWREFGQIYASFVQGTFYGPNHFQTESEALDFLGQFSNTSLRSSNQSIRVGRGAIHLLSVNLIKLQH